MTHGRKSGKEATWEQDAKDVAEIRYAELVWAMDANPYDVYARIGKLREQIDSTSAAPASQPVAPAEYGRSKSMDKRLAAQGKPAPSSGADARELTEKIFNLFQEEELCPCLSCRAEDGPRLPTLLESFRAETLARVAELEKALRDLLASCPEECHCAACMNAAHVLNASDPNWLARQIADSSRELFDSVSDMMSLIEFYAKREMESPSNHQEFVRETSEKLNRLRAALESTKSNLTGGEK